MMHARRRFCLCPVESISELADKLTRHTWTLCTAFRLGDYLFLNDSTSEDGAQEYAVVRAPTDDGPAAQVESITFGWCDLEKAAAYIRRTLDGEFDPAAQPVSVRVESSARHERCGHCA